MTPLSINMQIGYAVNTFVDDVTEVTWENSGIRSATTSTLTGTQNISNPGTYTGLRINGKLSITSSAFGVIKFVDCVIDCSAISNSSQGYCVQISMNTGATSVTLEHCEIIGQVGLIGIGPRRFKAYRCRIHHVEDGFRLHNSGAAADARQQDLDAEISNCYIGPHITETPDPYMTRTDLRTHSDGGQLEGGDGAWIHGNTFDTYNTTDGTSNLENFEVPPAATPYTAVPTGTPNSLPHPQALSCILWNPGVSPITNVTIEYNRFRGGAFPINGTSGAGVIRYNTFDRGSFESTKIQITGGSWTRTGNTYEDDGSPVS